MSYMIIKDYLNAADAFQHVKDMHKKFPKANLYYANMLKQAGRYEEAEREYANFLGSYRGSDKKQLAMEVERQIKVESWGGLTTRCEIYVIVRIGATWSSPERLRDYINLKDATTTHPYVFESQRRGGRHGFVVHESSVEFEQHGFFCAGKFGPRDQYAGE